MHEHYFISVPTSANAPAKSRCACGVVQKASREVDVFGSRSKTAKQRKDERFIAFHKNWRIRLPKKVAS